MTVYISGKTRLLLKIGARRPTHRDSTGKRQKGKKSRKSGFARSPGKSSRHDPDGKSTTEAKRDGSLGNEQREDNKKRERHYEKTS